MQVIEFNAANFAWWDEGWGEEGWDAMPLHDAFGVNSKKSATTENQGAGAWYMG